MPASGVALGGVADVAGVFVSRSEFAASVQPTILFDGARRVRMAGLSLNLICQQVPERYVQQMVTDGAELHDLIASTIHNSFDIGGILQLALDEFTTAPADITDINPGVGGL